MHPALQLLAESQIGLELGATDPFDKMFLLLGLRTYFSGHAANLPYSREYFADEVARWFEFGQMWLGIALSGLLRLGLGATTFSLRP